MKKHLYAKFIFGYILLGIVSFFLVSIGGSYVVERHIERSVSKNLYAEANMIASGDTMRYHLSSDNLDAVYENLSAISAYQNAEIWIVSNKGQLILNTDTEMDTDEILTLDHFDPSQWGSNYYQVGDFYGYFPVNRLSVIAPITADMTTKGYVILHYDMESLYQYRSGIVNIMQVLFLIIYALTYLLLFLYRRHIHQPLKQITKGASEFANGNLTYQIPVKSEDELGYLANTLNYMADKLNRNGEYQRRFISNVSHDFRSPLTSIKGYVEAMLDGTIPTEMQDKYLKIIAYEADRLEKLTRSLRTLNELDVKKRMLHMKKFDINDTIKNIAATFEGTCTERKIRLELILSGTELFVRADFEQIQQVVYNLLDNAIKFSFDNSSIILETTEKNGKVFVAVKDFGCGVSEESLPKIWERFYKTDSSRGKDKKGTGLGLSIVKEIINAHGQNINVISTVGVGTEFIFTLEKAK